MPRILVVGSSCAGKSTLSQKLSAALDLHYIQLDALQWMPGWTERDDPTFFKMLTEAVTQHSHWVIDGNYSRTHAISWPRAQVVVWLNYSYSRVVWRALTRTCRRVFTREQLYSGNVETFRRSFLSRDSILWWVIKTFHYRRRRYSDIRKKNAYAHLVWIELRRPIPLDALILKIESAIPAEKR
ncbi:MAG: adenylate kinase [Bacteroidota bacterium]